MQHIKPSDLGLLICADVFDVILNLKQMSHRALPAGRERGTAEGVGSPESQGSP
jgi:hypothetical protein